MIERAEEQLEAKHACDALKPCPPRFSSACVLVRRMGVLAVTTKRKYMKRAAG